MNRLDEVRIAGEGLERDRLLPSEERRDRVLLHIQRWKLAPGQRVFPVAPDPLNGVQLRAIGRQEYEADVFRDGELRGRVGAPMLQQQEIQAVRTGLRAPVDENLAIRRVEIRQFQEEAVARGRLHRPIHRAPLEDLLDGANRLHATGGEAPAADRQEAEAAVVLAKDPDGARVGGRDAPLSVVATARLEGRPGLRGFWCDRAGPP
jgi:hypothetical protein